jgi:ABC-type phosphate/phosphonate transport system substrate-binding protein
LMQNTTESQAKPRWLALLVLIIATLCLGALLVIYGPFRERSTPSPDRPAQQGPWALVKLALAPVHDEQVFRRDLRPLLRHLESALSIRVSAARPSTTRETIDDLIDGHADVALLPALGCVQAHHREPDLELLVVEARNGAATAPSVLVVRDDASINDLDDLRQRRICLVDSSSMSGALAVRLWLRSRAEPQNHLFGAQHVSGSHHRALRDLRRERCDVAAVSQATLSGSSGARHAQGLRVIARTGHTPGGCWIASPSLDARIADPLTMALTSFGEAGAHPSGWRPLWITGFQRAESSTYLAVKIAAQLEGLLQ